MKFFLSLSFILLIFLSIFYTFRNEIPSKKLLTQQDRNISAKKFPKAVPVVVTVCPEEEQKVSKKVKYKEKAPSPTAKLVIIMDDVSTSEEIAEIRSTGLPLVMSFLPPTEVHPDSATLAPKCAMLHLPLEAMTLSHVEPHTLMADDSLETIRERIKALKKLYPQVRYVNNHTGSKFTADKEAMERLITVLNEEKWIFVDSRTIGTTQVQEVQESRGLRYRGRDVFLDHQDGIETIKQQIKEAIAKAKAQGSAIAIGHPRPDTIEALKQSKVLLNTEVQVVGIEKI
jgi:hypothetical protein